MNLRLPIAFGSGICYNGAEASAKQASCTILRQGAGDVISREETDLNWFLNLSVAEKVYFIIAIIASVLLVIQIIMMLFSLGGGGDFDMDDVFDGDVDTDSGLSFFTVKGLTAFFALGGWCGFAAQTGLGDNIWAPILIAVATGTVALLGVGFAMRGIARLQCSGNLVKKRLVGMTATVYVSIPGQRTGRGKITFTAQGQYMEIDAVTDGERIPVDSMVEITEYSDDFAVVTKKQTENQASQQ